MGKVLVETTNVELTNGVMNVDRELFGVDLLAGGKQLRNDAVGRATKSKTSISELQCTKIVGRSSLIDGGRYVEIVSEIFFVNLHIRGSCKSISTSKFSFSSKDGSGGSLSGS